MLQSEWHFFGIDYFISIVSSNRKLISDKNYYWIKKSIFVNRIQIIDELMVWHLNMYSLTFNGFANCVDSFSLNHLFHPKERVSNRVQWSQRGSTSLSITIVLNYCFRNLLTFWLFLLMSVLFWQLRANSEYPFILCWSRQLIANLCVSLFFLIGYLLPLVLDENKYRYYFCIDLVARAQEVVFNQRQ